jgi:phosphoenolpyruvate-protein kinase (PTS system EI component)
VCSSDLPEFVPIVRDTLNAALFSDCRQMAGTALSLKTSAEVKKLLKERA